VAACIAAADAACAPALGRFESGFRARHRPTPRRAGSRKTALDSPDRCGNDAALAELIKRFPTPAEFQIRVESVGLQPEALRDIVRARVAIDKFLDFRFRAFIIISTIEVEAYYRDVYLPRFRQTQPGSVVPTLDAARERIERILTEEKIAADTDAFLQTARTAAEIVRLAQL
jgi:hypothetical protein